MIIQNYYEKVDIENDKLMDVGRMKFFTPKITN